MRSCGCAEVPDIIFHTEERKITDCRFHILKTDFFPPIFRVACLPSPYCMCKKDVNILQTYLESSRKPCQLDLEQQNLRHSDLLSTTQKSSGTWHLGGDTGDTGGFPLFTLSPGLLPKAKCWYGVRREREGFLQPHPSYSVAKDFPDSR